GPAPASCTRPSRPRPATSPAPTWPRHRPRARTDFPSPTSSAAPMKRWAERPPRRESLHAYRGPRSGAPPTKTWAGRPARLADTRSLAVVRVLTRLLRLRRRGPPWDDVFPVGPAAEVHEPAT